MSTVAQIQLTRAQIQEIVGDDQMKIEAFESLIFSAIVQDELVIADPDGAAVPWWVTRYANGKIIMRTRITTTGAFATYTLPYTLFDGDADLLDLATMVGSSYDSTSTSDMTVKFDNLTTTEVDIGTTSNGSLTGITCSVVIEARWKE